jgi:hypothetical protein
MGPGTRRTETRLFSHALAVIGAGGALAAWVAVVGGIREYARFEAAGVPSPGQTASLLPREALFAEGLVALLPALGIALSISVLAYLLARRALESSYSLARRPPSLIRRVSAAGTGLVSRLALVQRLRLRLTQVRLRLAPSRPRRLKRTDDVSRIAGLMILLGWLSLGLWFGFYWIEAGLALAFAAAAWWVLRQRWVQGAPAAAGVVLLVTIVNGGAAAFIEPLRQSDGRFDSVIVTRRSREAVSGFYLTRSGGRVYVLVRPAGTAQHPEASRASKFAILAVPDSEVELVEIGPSYHLSDGKPASPTEKAVVTIQPEPSGPYSYSTDAKKRNNGELTPTAPAANSSTTVSHTTKIVNTTTTNNNTKTSTTTTILNVAPQQLSPQQPSPLQPVVQLFTPNEVVPATDHFCFTVGASYYEATVRLRFSTPTLPGRGHTLSSIAGVALAAHGRRSFSVSLPARVKAYLRSGRRLPVNVKTIAVSSSGTKSSATYRLYLERQPSRPTRSTRSSSPTSVRTNRAGCG